MTDKWNTPKRETVDFQNVSNVTINLSDVMCEISESQLVDELKRRAYTGWHNHMTDSEILEIVEYRDLVPDCVITLTGATERQLEQELNARDIYFPDADIISRATELINAINQGKNKQEEIHAFLEQITGKLICLSR